MMNGLFLTGYTSLVESSAVGALAAMGAAILKRRMTREVFENTVRSHARHSFCMFMWIILAALALCRV
ncbi:MAG: hypothetical protein R3D29_13260 [Nitratireductor sp.]